MAETAAVVIAAAGAGLLYAAVTNQNPLVELRAALSTGSTAGSVPIRTSSYAGEAARSGASPALDGYAGEAARNGSTSTAPLVTIGQGAHKLTAPAAAAFQRWQSAFGNPIPVTDSYRDYAEQAGQYAANPSRFGNPVGNKHVAGLAVDVNLSAIGARPSGSNPSDWRRDPVYARLLAAATSAGFCNYQVRNGSTGSKIAEPWHFSFGVCG